VALSLTRSADFPVDKLPGHPCRHLDDEHRCGIHARLTEAGYRGCVAFDCFGAGQRITQGAYAGVDWRTERDRADDMFAAFFALRQLHEMLVLLDQARAVVTGGALRARVAAALSEVAALAAGDADALAAVDPLAVRDRVGQLLSDVSAEARGDAAPDQARIRRGADLTGADLRGVRLAGADLRGALLMGADLRAADLSRTDLLGADMRDADLRGADLRTALFVTGPQLASARGDAATKLAAALPRPASWALGRSG
jgi:hypothetical protein